jgi:preprotein translocase subunit YajC
VLGLFTLMAADTKSSFNPTSLLFIVLMIAVFYFLLIRPQQRRARGQRSLIDSLDVGDEIVTIGGMHGTITELDDEGVTIEIAPDVEVRFVKSAIARKLVFDDDTEDDGDDEGDDTDQDDDELEDHDEQPALEAHEDGSEEGSETGGKK